jgi:co-chaperonin GroES (HSP10)
MKLRPLSDRILLQLDPLPEETKGGIILVSDNSVSNVRTGTVLRVGPGLVNKYGYRIPVGVEPGERVAFLRWHLEHQSGKRIMSFLAGLGEDLGLIRGPDVLFAFPPSMKVEISQ